MTPLRPHTAILLCLALSSAACADLERPWMTADAGSDAPADVTADAGSDAPADVSSDTTAPSVPDASAPSVPDASAPSVPDASAPSVPDASAPSPADADVATTPSATGASAPSASIAMCPAMPPCTSAVMVMPTGGDGTDASPWVGWESLPSGACRVEFPAGVYLARARATVYSGLTVRGLTSGSARAVIRRADPASVLPIFGADASGALRNVVIEGFEFDHRNTHARQSDIKFHNEEGTVAPRENLRVQNNRFVNLTVNTQWPVDLRSGTTPGASQCFFVEGNTFLAPAAPTETPLSATVHAVFVQADRRVRIARNTVENFAGIYVVNGPWPGTAQPVEDLVIADNTLTRTFSTGIMVRTRPVDLAAPAGGCTSLTPSPFGPLRNVEITGNTITSAARGLLSYQGAIIVGVVASVHNPSHCAVTRPIERVVVRNNSLAGSPYGVLVEPSDDLSLPYGVWSDNQWRPFIADNVLVEDNRWTGVGPDGPEVVGLNPVWARRVRNLTVRNNTFARSRSGIEVSGTSITLRGNTLTDMNLGAPGARGNGALAVFGASEFFGIGTVPASSDVFVLGNTATRAPATDTPSMPFLWRDLDVTAMTVSGNTFTTPFYTAP